MRLPPPDVLATWPRPNFENPDRRGPALMIVECTILPIALVVLLLRLYVRLFIVRACKLDDWVMAAAMVFGIGVTVTVILASQLYGWDIHVWDLKPDQMIRGRQASIAAQTMFLFASGLAKTSILVSYLRIAPLDSMFRRLTYWLIGLVVALIPIFLVVLWTQCIPATDYWNLLGEHHCTPEGPPLMAQATLTVLTDFLVYILPLPTLIQIRLPVLQRVILIGVFSLGFISVFASCMRAYWVYQVVEATYDVTWSGFELWIWTAVEVNLGVICGCVPTLRPLFRNIRGLGSSGNFSSSTKQKTTTVHVTVDNRKASSTNWVSTRWSSIGKQGMAESLHSTDDDCKDIGREAESPIELGPIFEATPPSDRGSELQAHPSSKT